MRHAVVAFLILLAGLPASAQAPADTVVACETLVGLRLLMADGDRAAALARLPQHPACRMVARTRIGAAESRAMIGGAPFECLAIQDESRCAWVLP